MARALIFGTGAVGCIYGYILYRAGVEVTAVCRSNYEAIKDKGITIHSALWGTVHYQPTPVRAPEEASGAFDFIFVCAKAFPGNAKLLKAAVSPGTAVVIAQNGIGIEQEFADMYPDNTIISASVWLPTTQQEPGVISMGPKEQFKIGSFPADASAASKARVQELAKIWTAGGGTPSVHEDVQAERWAKLAVNCAFNPMSALTRCDGTNLLLSSDIADDAIVKVMREVGDTAAALGYREHFTEESIQGVMAWHRGRKETGGKDPSMLADVKAGRPMEVEAILGNTVRIAMQHGVQVPHLELLYCLAQALNFSITKPENRWKPTLY